jgi:hypothetical protein
MKYFLLFLLLTFPCFSQAQSKETLEKHIQNTLSYQHIKHKSSAKESQISIHQIEFNACTMSYPIFKKNGDQIERYTVRIFLPGISKITMTKNKEGYYVITFATNRKSIIKEYPDGNLVHEKSQTIPLKAQNFKALHYFEKLNQICLSRK